MRPAYIYDLPGKRYYNPQVGTPRAADGLLVVHSPVNAPPPPAPSVIDAGRVKQKKKKKQRTVVVDEHSKIMFIIAGYRV